MKRTIFAVLVLCGLGLLWADDFSATVKEFKGKVEVQVGDKWVPAKVGQVIQSGTTVSTGFRSELVLQLGPSLLTVKALTRLTVKELAIKDGVATTDLNLRVGKISADVKPVANTTAQAFKVTSPVSTASVRGTAFDFDGETLQVTRGLVQFVDSHGGSVNVPVGEMAKAPPPDSTKGMSSNQDLVSKESATMLDPTSEFSSASLESDWFDWVFSGFDEQSLLDFLSSYDWSSELPNTSVYIWGIQP